MAKIFINPGHCVGVDPGACGNGLKEAEVVLKVGRRVQDYLQAVGLVTKVFQYDGLGEICADSDSWGADLFLSIHCNAATGSASGTETFYCEGSEKGKKFASAVQNQIVKSLGTVDRGIKTNRLYVTGHTAAPAILIELAFIDNPSDAKLLAEQDDEFSRAIARGVTDYLQGVKPIPDVVDTPKNKPAGNLSEHFSTDEFACHHCGQCGNIHPKLVELLEKLRANMGGVPIHINSGYRCPIHNANVGGVPNSQHVLGTAADLAVPAGMNFEKFQWYIEQLPFDGIGLYPYSDFIHVDVRDGGVGSKIYWEG